MPPAKSGASGATSTVASSSDPVCVAIAPATGHSTTNATTRARVRPTATSTPAST
ncbi:hypothetical protein L603_000800001180 [Cellulosimicrobium cellulans J34]|nr:hypothetical protein L603_000800001180 [Cellulosimicrobium cellulans J34]